jgi:predicted AlkP superfamily phosphohydrolase/phosphomutase/tetratricopeptide (TPR) repeat protein
MKENNNRKRILLIGLDAAEWAIINDLIAAGMMPATKKLIDEGVSGNIKTLSPPFSPMLWTSIATGKTADKHGILSFVEPSGEKGIQPISSTSRKSRALWNIFTGKDLKSNVIGWWPSHPCEPINGVMISNQFQKIVGKKEDAWPVAEESTFGLSEEEKLELAACRIHPSDIGVPEMRVFVQELEKVEQDKDHRLKKIQTLIAEALTLRNATLWAMNKKDWDFTAVYFNELDVLSHDFMKFHPPHRKGIPEELYQVYKNVMVATYTLYDTIIAQLVKSAGEDTYVILCSDHGFYSGEQRAKTIPKFAAGIALEHNPNGVLCVTGPDIKKGQKIYNAGLLDITPTILSIMDFPIGKDMDGKVLQDIFIQPKKTALIDSWEDVAGNFGEHDKDIKRNAFSEQEALQQLVELGYIEPLEGDTAEKIAKCLSEREYNLSLVLASKSQYEDAIEILEKLYEEDLVDVRYNLDLIKYYRKTNNTQRAREILANFQRFDISNSVNFKYLEGKILFDEKKYPEALECYKTALSKSPHYKDLLLSLGILYNKMNKYEEAERTYKKILENDPLNLRILHGLMVAYNRSGKHEDAVDTALEILKQQPDQAATYYHLGEAFYYLERYDVSIQAFEVCLKLEPGISRARNMLLNIYSKHIEDPQKYAEHNKIYQETRKDEIIIVSGLPRSGTSMMMQMLHRGGMEVLSDDAVMPDESNPKGYFEFAPVKKTKLDNSWMDQAAGKAVKVIAQLLPALKMKHKLKVIFMERNINEVILSQNKMISLKSTEKKKSIDFDLRLVDTFNKQIGEIKDWVEEKNNIEILYVNYKDVIENPETEIRKINYFLNWQLNEDAMKTAIDNDLYRIKFN